MWSAIVYDMLAFFAACPVVVDAKQRDFMLCWNVICKAVKLRRNAALRVEPMAKRIAAGVCSLQKISPLDAENLQRRLYHVINDGYAELWDRIVRERCGKAEEWPEELLEALDEEGVTLYGVEDTTEDAAGNVPLKRKKKASTVHQTCVKYTTRTFCVALLSVYACWGPLVRRSSEIPPTMLTAAVRLGGIPKTFFASWTLHDTLGDRLLWLEHALCVGLYSLVLKRRTEDASSKSLEASSKNATDAVCAVDREEPDDSSDDDAVGNIDSPEEAADELSQRIARWQQMTNYDVQQSDTEETRAFMVNEPLMDDIALQNVDEIKTACDFKSKSEWGLEISTKPIDGANSATDVVANEWLYSDNARCDSDRAGDDTSSMVSSYVSGFQRNTSMLETRHFSMRDKAITRVKAVTCTDGSVKHSKWRGTAYHPYTVSMTVYAVCAAFAAMYFHSGWYKSANRCCLCRLDDHRKESLDNEGSHTSFVAMFWYYRIHWLSTTPEESQDAAKSRRMSASARQAFDMLQAHYSRSVDCVSCRFITVFVGVLGRFARRASTDMDTDVPGNMDVWDSTVQIYNGLFCVQQHWDEGLRFFEHAHVVVRMQNGAHKIHWGVAVEQGWDDTYETEGKGVVIDEVPQSLRDVLLTPAEQACSDEYCTVSMPSAFGSVLVSSVQQFTIDPSRGSMGVMQSTTADGGQTITACMHREDLRVMQSAIAPLVALDKRCYMDMERMSRCSGSVTAMRNILCGNAHELYYAMQWLRRCLFRRSPGREKMLAPESGFVTMYRMLPRLLSTLTESDLIESLAAPYTNRKQLSMRTDLQQQRTETLCGVELFYSDTVDLQRVTRNIRDDMFLAHREPTVVRVIPRRYDLRFVRNTTRAAKYVQRARRKQKQALRLFQVHAQELCHRRYAAANADRLLVIQRADRGHNNPKIARNDIFATQLQGVEIRKKRKQVQRGMGVESAEHVTQVAAMLGRVEAPRTDPALDNDDTTHTSVAHAIDSPIPLRAPRKMAFRMPIRGAQVSLYASLHAFILPVDARVCASTLMLSHVWEMLATHESLWQEYRLLAALLIELILSTSSERAYLKQLPAEQRLWVSWAEQRRAYVSERLRSACFRDSVSRVSSAQQKPDKTHSRGIHRIEKWCDCPRCALVSMFAKNANGLWKTTADRLRFQWVPPRPPLSMQRYNRGFMHAAHASETRFAQVPEQHAILPARVTSYPDMLLPTHYLLYEFAVDPRVNDALREMIFLGVKALPYSGRMECVSANSDGDTIQFRNANRGLEEWISHTIALQSEHIRAEPEQPAVVVPCETRCAAESLESLTGTKASMDYLDDVLKRHNFGLMDLALMVEASQRQKTLYTSASDESIECARLLRINAKTRLTVYKEWLGDVLVEWDWNRTRYAPCKNRYGALVLNAGNAVPIKTLHTALFTAELLSRLDFRMLHPKSQTRADTAAYNEKRHELYTRYTRIREQHQQLSKSLEETCGDNDTLLKKGAAELNAHTQQKVKQMCEEVMGKGVEDVNIAMRYLLNELTMREDVTATLVFEHIPSDMYQLRTLMTLCANDPYLIPPYVTERMASVDSVVLETPESLQTSERFRAIEPIRCMPVSYVEHLNHLLLLRRPINSALRGLAPSPLATTNALHDLTKCLRSERDIKKTQRLMRRIRHTVETLMYHSRAFQPQLFSCLYGQTFMNVSDVGARCGSHGVVHTVCDTNSPQSSPASVRSDCESSPFTMEDTLNDRVDRMKHKFMDDLRSSRDSVHNQHSIWHMRLHMSS